MRKPFLILSILLFISFRYTYAQITLFVSTYGSDESIGSIDSPYRTIQAALANANANDTIFLRGGIYRESVEINALKSGLKLFAYEDEIPIIKGSVILDNWIEYGEMWRNNIEIQPQQVFVNGNNPLQQIGYPNEGFKEDFGHPRYEYPVGAGLGDMSNGRFFWENGILYIMLEDGENPNTQKIEVSQLRRLLFIDASNVHVRGICFRHTNGNTYAEFESAVHLGDSSIFENCDVQWCDFGGVSMGYLRSGAKAINCNSSNNGVIGFDAPASFNFTISNCKANNNNYRNFYAQWHAGGFKATDAAWGVIENSEFSKNIGAGIWFDNCFENSDYRTDGKRPLVIRSNFIHDNSKSFNKNSALMIEVSEYALIQNNIIENNDYRGIYISGSWDCRIQNNVLAKNHNHHALDLAGMPNPNGKLVNNLVVNNIFYNNRTTDDIEIFEENNIDIMNNHCDYNLYHRDSGKIVLRHGEQYYSDISLWYEATSFDENSLESDPLFTDDIYHIDEDSPTINVGSPLVDDYSGEDFDGGDRLIGCRIDFGVYESLAGDLFGIHDASLLSLEISIGELLSDFSTCDFEYVNYFPIGMEDELSILVKPTNELSSVEIQYPIDITSGDMSERICNVLVTAEDGYTMFKYSIVFESFVNSIVFESFDNSERELLAFPNPSNGHVSIWLPNSNDKIILEICNPAGSVLKTYDIFDSLSIRSFDLSDLGNGMYILRLTTSGMTYFSRVLMF